MRPTKMESIIAEARSGRLLPGDGELPLRTLINVLPDDTVFSVEIPAHDEASPAIRARRIYDATMKLFLPN
jgi:hypothetical protein